MIPSNAAVRRWKPFQYDEWKDAGWLPAAHLTLDGMRVDLSGPKFRSLVVGGKIQEISTSYSGSGNDLHLKVMVPDRTFTKWTLEKWDVTFLR